NHIKYEVKFEKDLPEKIKTDKFRLEQVLKNLLSNAFKFTPAKGTVKLLIEKPKEDTYFNRASLNKDNCIAFIVEDTGIGIPPEKHELIFEAFQQADSSTSRKYGG